MTIYICLGNIIPRIICKSGWRCWAYHARHFREPPISVTLVRSFSQTTGCSTVSLAGLWAAAGKAAGHTGRTRSELSKHPLRWTGDEELPRTRLQLVLMAWRRTSSRASGPGESTLLCSVSTETPRFPRASKLLASSPAAWGHQGRREFHLGPAASLMLWNSPAAATWPADHAGGGSRRGTGRLCSNQAPLKTSYSSATA